MTISALVAALPQRHGDMRKAACVRVPLSQTAHRLNALPDAPDCAPHVTVLDHADARLSALLGAEAHVQVLLDRPIELFQIQGEAHVGGFSLQPGSYLRWPNRAVLHLHPGSLVYLASGPGHFRADDVACRLNATYQADTGAWFQSQESAVELLPLHGCGTTRVWLVRWLDKAHFRASLNPEGETILLLQGTLQDPEQGHWHEPLVWLRQPAIAWPTWHAEAGSLALYKCGHLHDAPFS